MSDIIGTTPPFQQWDYVNATDVGSTTGYDAKMGQKYFAPDMDISSGTPTTNGQGQRTLILVKNTSGGTLATGTALNWVSGYWEQQVQVCPVGSVPRCFVPAYIRGLTTNTIPNNAYFLAVYDGPTSVLTDGTSVSVNDGLVVTVTAGQVHTDYGIGGGAVYTQTVASTVLTNTVAATKYDKNYTFPANSLNAGDVIRVEGEISILSGNSTDTLATDLMLGSQVINTLTAFDPTNTAGDIIAVTCDISIRTAGASGTMVAEGRWTKNVNGTTTVVEFQLPSTAIDTTATQQLALRGTWSVANAADQSRQDALAISRINSTGVGIKKATAIAAVTGTGTAALGRARVACAP